MLDAVGPVGKVPHRGVNLLLGNPFGKEIDRHLGVGQVHDLGEAARDAGRERLPAAWRGKVKILLSAELRSVSAVAWPGLSCRTAASQWVGPGPWAARQLGPSAQRRQEPGAQKGPPQEVRGAGWWPCQVATGQGSELRRCQDGACQDG